MAANPELLRHGKNPFYLWAAIAIGLIVLAGFARTYYLKFLFGTPGLTGLVHVHGLVMSLWFLLFIVQVSLVESGRKDLHRRLGIAGTALAGVVVVVGVITAITAARLGHTPGPPPLVFLTIPLGDMVVFPLLVGIGVSLRRRGDFHKRFMLLASLSILTAAIGRLPLDFIHSGGLPLYFGLTDLLILAVIAWDVIRQRRLHPAFAWGFGIVVASQLLRFGLAENPAWLAFAAWLVGPGAS